MADETTRVDFNAPRSLVREADVVADLRDISRTDLLTEALRDRLDEITADEGFRRRMKAAYYEGRIDTETVEVLLGPESAMQLRLLRESLDREPPLPDADEVGVPPRAEFYDGELPTWTPDDRTANDGVDE